jgi:hypothetical protein
MGFVTTIARLTIEKHNSTKVTSKCKNGALTNKVHNENTITGIDVKQTMNVYS